MCGRYTLYQTGELKKRFNLAPSQKLDEMFNNLQPNYNVAPGQNLPVVTSNGLHSIDLMRWGLIPSWAKDEKIGYHMINARAETVFDKPVWKDPVLKSRCLIPANGFFEWQVTPKGKQPFYIHLKDQKLMAFAGFFADWTNKTTGEVIKSFTIITTGANRQMKSIHDRMPLILKPEDENRWLEPSLDTAKSITDLLRPPREDLFDIYPVSTDVNDARHNDAHLIQPESNRQ